MFFQTLGNWQALIMQLNIYKTLFRTYGAEALRSDGFDHT